MLKYRLPSWTRVHSVPFVAAWRGVDGGLHGRDGAVHVAVQLAGVRHAGVRGLVGSQVDHLLERGDGVVVAAELGVGVAEDAVAGGLVLVGRDRALAPVDRVLELVAGQRQRAEADQRVGVVGRLGERLVEDAVGAGVVARIARFASALQVGQAELRGARWSAGTWRRWSCRALIWRSVAETPPATTSALGAAAAGRSASPSARASSWPETRPGRPQPRQRPESAGATGASR